MVFMGDFRPNSRSGGFGRDRDNRGGFGGNRSGGFNRGGRGGGRGFGGERRFEMHDAICSNCGKECKVPFRPTGDKPVLCSDCFRQKENGSNSSRSFDRDKPRQSSQSQAGVSPEQFKQINTKLDRILKVLENLEIVEEGNSDDDLDEDLEDLDEEESEEDGK